MLSNSGWGLTQAPEIIDAKANAAATAHTNLLMPAQRPALLVPLIQTVSDSEDRDKEPG